MVRLGERLGSALEGLGGLKKPQQKYTTPVEIHHPSSTSHCQPHRTNTCPAARAAQHQQPQHYIPVPATSQEQMPHNASTPAPKITSLHHNVSNIARTPVTQQGAPKRQKSQHYITVPAISHEDLPHKTSTPASESQHCIAVPATSHEQMRYNASIPAPRITAPHHSTSHIARPPARQQEHPSTQNHNTPSQCKPYRKNTSHTTQVDQHQNPQHYIMKPATSRDPDNMSTPAPKATVLHHRASHIARSHATQHEHPSARNHSTPSQH